MNVRRLFLILGFIAFVFVAAFAIYFVFFKTRLNPVNTNFITNTNGTLPNVNGNTNRNIISNTNFPTTNSRVTNAVINTNASATANGGLTQVGNVVSGQITSTTLNAQTGVLSYYDKLTQKFYQLTPGGTSKEMTSQLFPDAKNVTWADSGNKAVIEFPDNSKILYDFSTQKQYTLPQDSEGFSFDPQSDKLAYKYVPTSVDDQWLVTTNIDGSGVQFVESIGGKASDVQVNWSPQGDVVATYRQSVDSNNQEIYFLSKDQQNNKSLLTDGRGFEGKWSPSGNQILYSVYSADTNFNPTLYIANGSGDAIGTGKTALDLQTWPDKCTFSNSGTIIYCAAPQYLSSGSGLSGSTSSTAHDDFYQINILTGEKRLLATPSSSVTANNLTLSGDGKTLYFTNKITGQLSSIRLP